MAETADLVSTDVAVTDVEPNGAARSSRKQVRMSGTGLQIPTDLSFEDWERAGRQLSGIVDSSAWWLGDWLVYGKANYSDRYQLAIQGAGLRYQTLRNYAWVARRFDHTRRRAKLTFQHHAEVASLPLEEQEWLLDQAERGSWTTKQLRNAIRAGRNGEDLTDERALAAANARIQVPNSRVGVWRKAADCVGVEFDHWVLTMLDRAATEILQLDPAEVLV